ncbi:hypothetical protein HPB50_009840 [Hyalomma asiaticum]|uniref:Uncharacterized protein n=1 Tax=Hyalomma asiaticum TaxID=266040 RepID=A0ACB7S3X9_HYAAI|nr:hypothetical protein HPB50_009840 [Hyalomma asiaticum]
MQQRAGSTESLDSNLVRELFVQRLPVTVRIGVTASGEMDIFKIAELADRLMAVTTPARSCLSARRSLAISRLAGDSTTGERKPKDTPVCCTTRTAVLVP